MSRKNYVADKATGGNTSQKEGACPGKTPQRRFHTIWKMQFKRGKLKQN